MASDAKDDDGLILGINVTPLVDVTLVLLIVFMITAKAIMSSAIPMPLPKASTPTAVETVLRVGVDPNGALTLDGAPMADGPALSRTAAARARALGTGGDTRAVIAAAKTASHGSVITAIDALRTAGIEKIAFAVEKKP
jgi:biopolymer transport protein ExbD